MEYFLKDLLKLKLKTEKDLHLAKRNIAKKYRIDFPKNIDLLETYHELLEKKRIKRSKDFENLVKTRPVRSLSGIVNVSVLTKPYNCPGRCTFCPTEKEVPKSYLKKEPAVQRAVLTNFDPYLQTIVRLKSLEKTGHPTDKIELRIIGGTWSYYPFGYQSWFIKECFKAANQFPSKRKLQKVPLKKLKKREKKEKNPFKKNEKANCRIVGITVETRPDFITRKEIKRMRSIGITRVELGVQSIYDDVLEKTKRGHSVSDTKKATKLLKDAGFKISYQVMPNLPGSDLKRDVQMFKKIFEQEDFCPDLLKIYPLALVKKSEVYRDYKKGEFKPYTKEELINLLIEIKKQVPYYCRIQRVIRDIPAEKIVEGGSKCSNLREIVQKEMKKGNLKCKCIRCREIKKEYNKKEKVFLKRRDYDSSQGKEIFLSYEDKKENIYALLKLRIPSDPFQEVLKNSSIIREIHTYGEVVVKDKKEKSPQHKGMGKKLIKEAERITKKEFNLKNISVIAGVGVRDYFRKQGYRLNKTYMKKVIK